jgi:RNA polymerase sigma-70 factor (ECF subfamily)
MIPNQRDPADERTLVDRAVAGDRLAFGDLYAMHQPTVRRFIANRVRSNELVDDLTQTVFLRAMSRIGGFEHQGVSIAAWLTTIARNLVADHYKSGRHRLEVSTGDYAGLNVADVARPAETALMDVELATAVRRAVQILTDDQRAVMELKYFDGLEDAETAARLGMTVGAVKALAYRARRTLLSRAGQKLEGVR